MSKHMYSTANLTDVELKDQGNRMFSARKYEDAINLYTKAIIKNPTNATYFTNRALCHIKMKRWDSSCTDCRRALDMDPNLVKGHFFLGLSLMELDSFDEAIKHLMRAHDLAKEQKLNFGDDIASQLRLARKKRWNIQEEKRICQEIELQSYLNRLINEDMENRIAKLKLDDTLNEDAFKDKSQEIESECENHTIELNNIFAKVDEKRRKREISLRTAGILPPWKAWDGRRACNALYQYGKSWGAFVPHTSASQRCYTLIFAEWCLEILIVLY
ncbi:E3 ubiquitin-protein ligase CHIP isoform X2 [Culex quinquefasciatus]|uniref:E3 ubiquitin-protein ligase CHIP isoform X2 n=1 Tax=Culex quinquefasciatus TaxID=7176 RepID=UPI0018E2BF11|nr:E3 ubiquitin-protein ligase CHIP isoform X2 [Culex quinquefasciatus]